MASPVESLDRRTLLRLLAAGFLVPSRADAALPFLPTKDTTGAITLEMLPFGVLTGGDAATLYVVVSGPGGAFVETPTIKATASSGDLGEVAVLRSGLLKIPWTPRAQTEEVRLRVWGASPEKERFSRTWALPVRAPVAARLGVLIEPDVVETQGSAVISVGMPSPGASLRSACSLGQLGDPTYVTEADAMVPWTAPVEGPPAFVGVAVVDARDPGAAFGMARLAFRAPTDLELVVEPDAEVTLRDGPHIHGPAQSDRKGAVTVIAVMSPDTREVTAVSKVGEDVVEEKLSIALPAAPRFVVFPLPDSAPADPARPIPLRVAAWTDLGAPDPSAVIEATSELATFSPASHDGEGIHRLTLTPGTEAGEGTVVVTVDGFTAEVPLVLVPRRAAEMTVGEAAWSGAGFALPVTLTDASGEGLPGTTLRVTAAGARLSGDPEDHGDGRYTVQMKATGSRGALVWVTAPAAAGRTALDRLLALTDRDSLPTDGLSSARITVLSLDGAGDPVADVPLEISVAAGDGAAPAAIATDAAGLATFHYTAGRSPGLVLIRLTGPDVAGGVALLQFEGEAPAALPRSGSAADLALAEDWAGLDQRVEVAR